MGPEYFALGLTAVISSIGGGSWVANKILSRAHDRVHNSVRLFKQTRESFEFIGKSSEPASPGVRP
jgi:hypothetical protein